ncbi:MAG: hypothetical protein AB7U20_01535 [Planctomycetaceae bacterium]
MSKALLAVMLVLAATLVSGCAKQGPQFYVVEGVVTVDGAPMDNLAVEFWPTGPEGPKSSSNTDAQGRFALKTVDGKGIGAVEGKHKVVVRDNNQMQVPFAGRANENVDTTQGVKPRIADKFTNFNSTPLEVEITGEKRDLTL